MPALRPPILQQNLNQRPRVKDQRQLQGTFRTETARISGCVRNSSVIAVGLFREVREQITDRATVTRNRALVTTEPARIELAISNLISLRENNPCAVVPTAIVETAPRLLSGKL